MLSNCDTRTLSTRTSGATEFLDVAGTHQFAIAKRRGRWEMVETPQLTQAKAEIARLNRELEQRVLERTMQLEAAMVDQRQGWSDLQETQKALAHVTRLTTISELTASLAHQVNQPLTAIVANATASLRWLDRTPPAIHEATDAMRCVIRDAERAGNVIAHTRGSVRMTSRSSSSPSSRPSVMAWGWGCRSPVLSPRITEDGCGLAATQITGSLSTCCFRRRATRGSEPSARPNATRRRRARRPPGHRAGTRKGGDRWHSPEAFRQRGTADLQLAVCAFVPQIDRIRCPACGEEDPEKLPSFSAPQHAGVRVGACESCKTYVKSIDPDAGRAQGAGDRRSGRALDGPLGGVAGYRRLEPGLAGL